MRNLLLLFITSLALLFTSCEAPNSGDSDRAQAATTSEMLSEANRQIGMPNIVNFQESDYNEYIDYVHSADIERMDK